MDNIWRNVPQAGAGDNVLPHCKVWQSLRCIMVLEESRTTTISGNKAITAAPSQDGLTIIIFNSVKGNAWTVPNRINNKGWLNLGFLTGAKLKISKIFVIIIHFCLIWYLSNDADTLIHWYVNKIFINLCVSSRYCEQWVGDGACKKSWCVEYLNLMPLATDKYSGNIFQFMKSEESMAGEDSEPEESCSELAGTHFTIRKIKFRWKFRSSKGPKLD